MDDQVFNGAAKWTVESMGAFLLSKVNAANALSSEQWATQKAVNIASNEWRGTVGDLKRDFATRAEMASLESRFITEQLSTARLAAATLAAKETKSESKEDWKSWVAIAVAAVALVWPSFKPNGTTPVPAPVPNIIVVPTPTPTAGPTSVTPTITTTTRP